MLTCVITTIQTPTSSVRELARKIAGRENGCLVIAGDTKGPASFDLSDVAGFDRDQLAFLDIDAQLVSGFELASLLPTKHYSRKNIGYLHAIQNGASCIYETDDDNAPLAHWAPRSEHLSGLESLQAPAANGPAWVNVYRHFSHENIWPRGLPLDRIHAAFSTNAVRSQGDTTVWAPIQQGLANGSPDVDAIWRLVMDREFHFQEVPSVYLPPGQWCPFNTQSTWWWSVAFPLLYIPSFCSFRMCDIWKSFVAQRCLWELGTGVVFHAAEVWQDRNLHNLMRDFQDEVPGYLHNDAIARCLTDAVLRPGMDNVGSNLRVCYQQLIEGGFLPDKELALVDAWLTACAEAVHAKVK